MLRRDVSFGLAALLLLAATFAGAAQAEPITKVEAKRVCMVNDTVFPRDQIPVQVDGRTYFGCCEMCKGKLTTDAAIRKSVDPVSGQPVDKATAVIGALPDGKVQYFESDKTFNEYLARP